MKTSPIAHLVIASSRFPRTVLALVLAITAAALVYAVQHFAMTTDTAQLISPKTAWSLAPAMS